jgi:subtilisin family serine protease
MDTIYRLPPIQYGPSVFLAADIKDTIDWGQEQHGLRHFWESGNRGKGNRIAVIDTGCPQHRDLPTPAFAHNFTNRKDAYDENGHATHVASTIAAKQDDRGIVGVAPDAEVGYCKVLGPDGTGNNRWIAAAIYKAIDEKCNIINLSLGGGPDQIVARACMDAVQSGLFVICAAGNEGLHGDLTVSYPAALDYVVAVAAYNRDGHVSQFSSRGPEVDIAFPGEDIMGCWLNNTYRKLSGTSMATPFACGVVALMRTAQITNGSVTVRNNTDLLKRLRESAIDHGDLGHDHEWGWGVVDESGFIGRPKLEDESTSGDARRKMPCVGLLAGMVKMKIIDIDEGLLGRSPELVGKTGAFLYLGE